MKENRKNHDSVVESVLEGIRCAQCTWCSEMASRRKSRQNFLFGALVGAGLLFTLFSVVRW